MAVSEYTLEVVDQLSADMPAIRQLVSENVQDNGELLPHMLFGEIAPWAEREFAAAPDSADLRVLLDTLDTAYLKGDPEFRNVLEASFVENLGLGSAVLDLLGPNLAAFADLMFPWRGSAYNTELED